MQFGDKSVLIITYSFKKKKKSLAWGSVKVSLYSEEKKIFFDMYHLK